MKCNHENVTYVSYADDVFCNDCQKWESTGYQK